MVRNSLAVFSLLLVASLVQAQERRPSLEERWEQAVRAGDLAGAIELLQPGVDEGQLWARSLLALTLYRAGRPDDALVLLERLIEEGAHAPPSHTVGWYWVRSGWCHQARQDLQRAAECYGRAHAQPGQGHLEAARKGLASVHDLFQRSPTILFVEVFGGSEEEQRAALELSGLAPGILSPGALEQAKARLREGSREEGRFRYADVFSWIEGGQAYGVLIDVVGSNERAPEWSQAGTAPLAAPPAVLDASRRYAQAFQRTLSDQGAQALAEYEAAEEQMAAAADGFTAQLVEVVRDSGDAEAVRGCAYAAGYLTSPVKLREVVAALSTRFADADAIVRNATLRSAALLEQRYGLEHGPLVDVELALRAFEHPGVLDRQKAGGILAALARHPSLRPRIREAALERARAVARTRLSMHRRGGLVLLRELEGETQRLSDARWEEWLERHAPESTAWWRQYADAEHDRPGSRGQPVPGRH